MSDQEILRTTGLTMRFGGVTAVNNVNFSIDHEGELRCLLGPNGAGKSTFFKCLTGQLVPTEGAITFMGESIAGMDTHEIVNLGIGIKTQVPNLFNGLSAYDNVRLAAKRKHLKRQAIEKTFDMLSNCGIENLKGSEVGLLSHGQRQLIELAMVLAAEPTLVLLDEPAAGMTGEERDRLAFLVKEVTKTASVIVVEHDMAFIKQIAKNVTVFHRGEIFAEDDVKKIMKNKSVQEIYLGKSADAA